jgi:hypothetical protein
VTPIKERCGPKDKNGHQSTATHANEGAQNAGIGVMLKTIYAVVAAAIVAGAFVAFLSFSMQVEAHAHGVAAKGDRADARPLGGHCSQNAWPYFEATCLRDTHNPFGQVAQVRIVSTDRTQPAGAGAH